MYWSHGHHGENTRRRFVVLGPWRSACNVCCRWWYLISRWASNWWYGTNCILYDQVTCVHPHDSTNRAVFIGLWKAYGMEHICLALKFFPFCAVSMPLYNSAISFHAITKCALTYLFPSIALTTSILGPYPLLLLFIECIFIYLTPNVFLFPKMRRKAWRKSAKKSYKKSWISHNMKWIAHLMED